MMLINSNKVISLQDLILSDDTNDKTLICIYSSEGKFICRDNWYADKVLEYAERFGKAHRAGTGRTITFQLI